MVHSSWAEGPTDFASMRGAPGRIAPRQDRAPRRDWAFRGGQLMRFRSGIHRRWRATGRSGCAPPGAGAPLLVPVLRLGLRVVGERVGMVAAGVVHEVGRIGGHQPRLLAVQHEGDIVSVRGVATERAVVA